MIVTSLTASPQVFRSAVAANSAFADEFPFDGNRCPHQCSPLLQRMKRMVTRPVSRLYTKVSLALAPFPVLRHNRIKQNNVTRNVEVVFLCKLVPLRMKWACSLRGNGGMSLMLKATLEYRMAVHKFGLRITGYKGRQATQLHQTPCVCLVTFRRVVEIFNAHWIHIKVFIATMVWNKVHGGRNVARPPAYPNLAMHSESCRGYHDKFMHVDGP